MLRSILVVSILSCDNGQSHVAKGQSKVETGAGALSLILTLKRLPTGSSRTVQLEPAWRLPTRMGLASSQAFRTSCKTGQPSHSGHRLWPCRLLAARHSQLWHDAGPIRQSALWVDSCHAKLMRCQLQTCSGREWLDTHAWVGLLTMLSGP